MMSTSQGTYDRIEQTSEAIRVTYEYAERGGARTGIEKRWCKDTSSIVVCSTADVFWDCVI